MRKEQEFGEFLQIIYDECLEIKRLLLKISRQKELTENYPHGKATSAMSEQIVLPLLVMQK